jgi:polysaccharide export outer membrane protein
VLEFKVFQEPDLDTRVRISQDGIATLPLIGSVRLAGRTVDDAAGMIRQALDQRFLVNPQVHLSVIDYAKRRFTVLGEVQKPGSYEIPNEETVNLLQAIAMAGGYTRIGEPSRITLVRVEGGSREIKKLNARDMAKNPKAQPFEIRPDDTITVGESVF